MPEMGDPLYVDRCSHDAMKYAAENWHYSGTLSTGKKIGYGVWEYGEFKGVIVYGRSATPNVAKHYGLEQPEVCELTRIALNEHETPVSRLISLTLKLLHQSNPGVKIVVSFADPKQGHVGTVYQAANWYYEGRSQTRRFVAINGEAYHPRSLLSKLGTTKKEEVEQLLPNARVDEVQMPAKFKYSWPFDDDLEHAVAAIEKPYPSVDDIPERYRRKRGRSA